MNTLTVFAELCVHQNLAAASCDACVRACPQSAWKINADGLSYNQAACDGCGLCVANCPSEALALPPATPLVRSSQAGTEVLIACECAAPNACAPTPVQAGCQSGSAGQMSRLQVSCTARLGRMVDLQPLPTVGITACLQALTPHWILHWAGIRAGSRVLYASGNCQQCARGRGPSWQARFEEVAAVLQATGGPVPQLLSIPFSDWQQAAVQKQVPDVGRRGLLRALVRPPTAVATPAQLVPMTSARAPLLKLLHAQGVGRALWAVTLDTTRCTWCMACIELCRSGALEFVADAPSAPVPVPAPVPHRTRSPRRVVHAVAGRFVLNMQTCTGCNVCLDVCDQQALSGAVAPGREKQASSGFALQLAQCAQCGVGFYHVARRPAVAPRFQGTAATGDKAELCPVCRQGRARQFDRYVQAVETA